MGERGVLSRGAAGVLALSAGALAFAAATGAGSAAPAGAAACTPAAGGAGQTFAYAGRPQSFAVPPRVTRLTVAVEGAHGGQYADSSRGGAGGGVDASVPVTPGECLTVYAGGYGDKRGGFGWGAGGDGGKISGDGSGHSAAGGGGASALLRGAAPLVVAGGGGAGGGDGASQYGGNGGDGGASPRNGHDAAGNSGGAGGRGGAASGRDGQRGDGNSEQAIGAGGGGGGGLDGGRGGGKGRRASGGGGGGGGRSAVATGVTGVTHFTSTRSCPYKKTPSTCNGAVTLSWSVAAETGEQPLLPLGPLVRVLSLDIDKAASTGVPISVAGASGRLRLDLLLGETRVASRTVTAKATGGTTVKLRPTAAARTMLGQAKFASARIRAIHDGKTSAQSLALH